MSAPAPGNCLRVVHEHCDMILAITMTMRWLPKP